MRVAVGSFEYEGNSLSLKRDDEEFFARHELLFGEDILPRIAGRQLALTGGVETIEKAGHQAVPLVHVRGGAGGRVVDAFYCQIRDKIVDGVRTAMPLDGVFLSLHGAMITDSVDDPEGEILQLVRDVVGANCIIAVSLDLHANVTPEMVGAADIIVGYEEYPHVDVYTTGIRAGKLLVDALSGRIRPVTKIRRLNAILPVLGGFTGGESPMSKVRRLARRLEEDGDILSASYFPVQPWIDTAGVGIAGLAVGDGNCASAEAAAENIVLEMWDRRHEFELSAFTPAEAVTEALSREAQTVLIVDGGDSVGAGCAGDAPALLRALLEVAPDVESAVFLVDAQAAKHAYNAGVGATLDFEIGASVDRRFHSPVHMKATVENLSDGTFVYDGGPEDGKQAVLGPCATLRCRGVRVVVASHPVYEYRDMHYRVNGVDIRQTRIASFKNLINFRLVLGPNIDWLALDTPGSAPLRLETVNWTSKPENFWPRDRMSEPPFMD